MTDYSRITLATGEAGQPAGLPFELLGLDDVSLADLGAALNPVPKKFAGTGFWPVDVEAIEFDPRAKAETGSFAMTPDTTRKRVAARSELRDLTADEIAALPALAPETLGKLQFILLAQSAGGMTDKMLVDAQANPAFAAFWIKYQMASAVERDSAVTTGALDALSAGGYLPNGKAAVLAAWPTA